MAFLFDIKRYSINDGPGIRVTVFFKGCPLSCTWCHNPESQSYKTEKLYNKNKCIGCSSCVEICPEKALALTAEGIQTDFTKCTLCGKCAEVCPTNSMEMSGRNYSEEEVMAAILKEIPIMDSSAGGVTFSGGEPLAYPKELKKLLVKCGAEGIHRAVDTSGYAKRAVIEYILPHTDLFLYDLKHLDTDIHRKWVGVDNAIILENLDFIAASDKAYHVRIPLIEGVNTTDENISATIGFLKSLKRAPDRVGLLPYHNIAANKYEKLGRVYEDKGLSEPSKERQLEILNTFIDNGFDAVIGG